MASMSAGSLDAGEELPFGVGPGDVAPRSQMDAYAAQARTWASNEVSRSHVAIMQLANVTARLAVANQAESAGDRGLVPMQVRSMTYMSLLII
jgi:hypothetical protein